MSKTLYLECSAGISGDMTVAALLDLGVDSQVLQTALDSLNLDGYQIGISRADKSGINACDFQVILDPAHDGHDHDMEYLHGSATGHMHTGCGKTETHHEHRNLADILEILNSSGLSERAKTLAVKIFTILAQAEAKAHGTGVDQVHFHEVGAVDSIVDVAAVAVCLDQLDVTSVIIPELSEGRGMIRCQHGIIPVPVPAVVNIVKEHQLALRLTDVEGELVTPTGAAIAAAIKTSDTLPGRFRIQAVGLGAGKRNYERPSILRAMVVETAEQEK